MAKHPDILAQTREDLEEAIDRVVRKNMREDGFPMFLHFGNRALELCMNGGRREQGQSAATWYSRPIPTDDGVRLFLAAAVSRYKEPVQSDCGPYIRDVRLPRATPQVYQIRAWSQDRSAWRPEETEGFVVVGDRNQVETNLAQVKGRWDIALELVGQCLDASTTRELPEIFRAWHEQQ